MTLFIKFREKHLELTKAANVLELMQRRLDEIARVSDASMLSANPGHEVQALLTILDDIHALATESITDIL